MATLSFANPAEPRRATFETVALRDVAAGNGGFKIAGGVSNEHSGYAVASIGDLNRDSRAEILVGAPGAVSGPGALPGSVYVVFGKADGAQASLAGLAAGAGSGYRIAGEANGNRAGQSIGAIGDLNGDGLPEVLLGAPFHGALGMPNVARGSAYVVFGKTDASLVALSDVAVGAGGGYALRGATFSDLAGISVGPISDLNSDGKPDLLVGAPLHISESETVSGAVFVSFGKADLQRQFLSEQGYKITGVGPVSVSDIDGARVGRGVAGENVGSVGDLNGDRLSEILITDRFENEAYVVFGDAEGFSVEPFSGFGLTEVARLEERQNGFRIIGESGDVGASIGSIGDLNDDGIPEILVGDTSAGTQDVPSAGAVYVIFGKNLSPSALEGRDIEPVDLADIAAGDGGFKIAGEAPGDAAGRSVAAIGDLNGDGKPEIIVGAPGNDAGGSSAGAAYVVFGKPDGALLDLRDVAAGRGGVKIVGEAAGDLLGVSVGAIRDLNGDSRDDILIGAPTSGANDAGAAYAVFSQADWIFGG